MDARQVTTPRIGTASTTYLRGTEWLYFGALDLPGAGGWCIVRTTVGGANKVQSGYVPDPRAVQSKSSTTGRVILDKKALHLACVRVSDQKFIDEVLPRHNKQRRSVHVDGEGNLKPRNVFRTFTRSTGTYGHVNMGINEVRGVFQYRSEECRIYKDLGSQSVNDAVISNILDYIY